jgi:endonuclease/exonuclease/phosphatase family metal-dependent hydrolase
MTRHRGIVVRVLTWNLFHGRDFPPDRGLLTWRSRLLRATELGDTHAQVNRPLLDEFAGWLADRPWEIALLQEAPPRWHEPLAQRTGAGSAIGLTSRNELRRLRQLVAEWNPDLIASNEGGSNQILVRAPARIVEVRRLRLRMRPERRAMLFARVELPDGRRMAVANLHATAGDPHAAGEDVLRAAERALEWAGGDALVFGGDLNLRPHRTPAPFERLANDHGLVPRAAGKGIDHLFTRGLEVVEAPVPLAAEERDVPGPGDRKIRLSDHTPVAASFGLPGT